MIFFLFDWFVFVVYGVVFVGVGVVLLCCIDMSIDYVIVGCMFGCLVLMGMFIGLVIGVVVIFGKVGKVYEVGYVVLLVSVVYFFGYVFFVVFVLCLCVVEIDSLFDVFE